MALCGFGEFVDDDGCGDAHVCGDGDGVAGEALASGLASFSGAKSVFDRC
jgi:hypothetical protein